MQTRRKNRLYIVLAVAAGLGLAVSLTLYALSANIDLFYTPGEIIYGKTETHEKPHVGQRLRIGGYVQPGSVRRNAQTLDVSFTLYDAAFCRTCFARGRAWSPRASWIPPGTSSPARCWPGTMKTIRRRR